MDLPSRKMALTTRSLYSFLGVHSFLIGLLPFYIPVYLYKTGFSLGQICFFVAVTGLGFCISLYLWDRISKRVPLRYLMVFSLLSELVLFSLFFMEKNMNFILISGIFNGVFNCSFWMIQRLLFVDTVTPQNSGKKFGNFQIFVLLLLKAGIFIGGVMLENSGYLSVYILCVFIVTPAVFFFLQRGIELDAGVVSASPLSLKFVTGYKDRFNSRVVFAVDGIFLYLESYFWMISLFLVVRQSYWKLGLLVMFLMVLFGAIFVIIKNSIDRLPADKMYAIAVCLYSLSWILRGVLSDRLSTISILLLLFAITFCTSIFRLSFNKRFFDMAKSATAHEYIYIKSYFSQFFLAVSALSGFLLLRSGDVVQWLSKVYMTAAFIALIYLFYIQEKKHNC
ncbi:MAG: MFS transporter [Desulfobacula sp.]|nr:MFS transporter [Desulfobacula sp.]